MAPNTMPIIIGFLSISIVNLYQEINVQCSTYKNYLQSRGYKGKAMYVALDKPTAVRMQKLVMKYWPEYLKELEGLFQKFEGCSLKKTAKNFIEFQGYKNSDILVIDGAPNLEEDKAGKSFVSEKGNLFDKILKAIELKREDIFIVNGVPWRPPGNRYPTEQEINICRPFIFNLIKGVTMIFSKNPILPI